MIYFGYNFSVVAIFIAIEIPSINALRQIVRSLIYGQVKLEAIAANGRIKGIMDWKFPDFLERGTTLVTTLVKFE